MCMISRDQIETLLKINGISPASPDEYIRSVLLSARYNHDEVDTALMVLRQDSATNQTRVDGLHKVFRSNQGLQPKEISRLLGIEVDASTFATAEGQIIVNDNFAALQYMIVWFFSVVLAVAGILLYMYLNKVGLFHSATAATLSLPL